MGRIVTVDKIVVAHRWMASSCARAGGLIGRDCTWRRLVVALCIASGVMLWSGSAHAAGSEFVLPDGREWQLVSPPDKHGAVIEPIPFEGVVQAAENGSAVTYLTNGSIAGAPSGNANLSQVLSTRSPAGWQSQDIAGPHEEETGQSVGAGQEYRQFSRDLARAIVQQPAGTVSERPIDLREGVPCEAMAPTCVQPLVTAVNTVPGAEFGGPRDLEFIAATPD
jgi:hypothetical protein